MREPAAAGTVFGQVREEPCPLDGGQVTYRYGNWSCDCGWATRRDVTGPNGGTVTLERCPRCGGRIVYNGNYLCEYLNDACNWALPHPARGKADRELALRLTGETR